MTDRQILEEVLKKVSGLNELDTHDMDELSELYELQDGLSDIEDFINMNMEVNYN